MHMHMHTEVGVIWRGCIEQEREEKKKEKRRNGREKRKGMGISVIMRTCVYS